MIQQPLIGFLEEAPGVRSMARLAVLGQSIAVLVISLALAVYLLGLSPAAAPPDAGVIAALGVPLVGLAAGIWSALKERTETVTSAEEKG